VSPTVDIVLGVLLVLAASTLLWCERDRLSRVISGRRGHGAEESSLGGHFERLAWQSGFIPGRARAYYVGAKVALAVLLPLVAAELLPLTAALIAAPAGVLLPDLFLMYVRARRKRTIRRSLSFFLDLLLSLTQGGIPFHDALERAVREGLPRTHPLAMEGGRAVDEMRLGGDPGNALRMMAARSGLDELHSLAGALGLALRRGTSVEGPLKTHADVARARRREDALKRLEMANAEVLLPLMLCGFPVFVVLVFAPLAIQVFQSLRVLGAILR
jgi:tight adherence protein C